MGSGVGGIIFHLKDKTFQFPKYLYCNTPNMCIHS